MADHEVLTGKGKGVSSKRSRAGRIITIILKVATVIILMGVWAYIIFPYIFDKRHLEIWIDTVGGSEASMLDVVIVVALYVMMVAGMIVLSIGSIGAIPKIPDMLFGSIAKDRQDTKTQTPEVAETEGEKPIQKEEECS